MTLMTVRLSWPCPASRSCSRWRLTFGRCCTDSEGEVLEPETATKEIKLNKGRTVLEQQRACSDLCAKDALCVKSWYRHKPGLGLGWTWTVIQKNPEYCYLFEVNPGDITTEDTKMEAAITSAAGVTALAMAGVLAGGTVVHAGIFTYTAWFGFSNMVVFAACPPCGVAILVASAAVVVGSTIHVSGDIADTDCRKVGLEDNKDMCFSKSFKGTRASPRFDPRFNKHAHPEPSPPRDGARKRRGAVI